MIAKHVRKELENVVKSLLIAPNNICAQNEKPVNIKKNSMKKYAKYCFPRATELMSTPQLGDTSAIRLTARINIKHDDVTIQICNVLLLYAIFSKS